MYPQTHAYFAEKVFGKLSDAQTLGSIFPDIAIGVIPSRQNTHGRGIELLKYMQEQPVLYDFARGIITHGIAPEGLDYYGDEKYLSYEKGYCFEKGRSLVKETIQACNIPPEMGWWKAHNIVEMGIELLISAAGSYGSNLTQVFSKTDLITQISKEIAGFYQTTQIQFQQRIYNFSNYIDTSKATPESLAARYDVQMFTKHHIHIDTTRVAQLISLAAELVIDDLDNFFAYVLEKVKKNLSNLKALN